MKKSVLITGESGSGKSSVCDELGKMGYKAYDLDGVPGLFSMIDKKTGKPSVGHDNKDLEKVKNIDWVCDVDKLKNIIANEESNLAFYCGAASNFSEIGLCFNSIVLLKASPENLRHRLTTRTSNDYGNTRDVQDWIMSRKEPWENEVEKNGAIVINADQDLHNIALEVLEKVNGV
ncbi:MAG: AAA family ATPase [Nanoarchaeota archaeon]